MGGIDRWELEQREGYGPTLTQPEPRRITATDSKSIHLGQDRISSNNLVDT